MMLTDDQIERAAKRMWIESQTYSVSKINPWPERDYPVKKAFLQAVRDVVPLLQMPWDMPSDEEIRIAAIRYSDDRNSLNYAAGEGINRTVRLFAPGLPSALANFVCTRNRNLIFEVDPRRDKIKKALHRSSQHDWEEGIVDRIIGALDEKP